MKLYEALMIVGLAAPLTPLCRQMSRYVTIPRPRTAVEHSETNYSVKWSEGAGGYLLFVRALEIIGTGGMKI